jgi:hypothetical protein
MLVATLKIPVELPLKVAPESVIEFIEYVSAALLVQVPPDIITFPRVLLPLLLE